MQDVNDRLVDIETEGFRQHWTVSQVVTRFHHRPASAEALTRAAVVFPDGSPAMLEHYAIWEGIQAALADTLDSVELALVFACAYGRVYSGEHGPPAEIAIPVLARLDKMQRAQLGAHFAARGEALARRVEEGLAPVWAAIDAGEIPDPPTGEPAERARWALDRAMDNAEALANPPWKALSRAAWRWRERAASIDTDLSALNDAKRWRDAGDAQREQVVDAIGRALADLGLRPVATRTYGGATPPVAMFRHDPSEVLFVLVPGGTLWMGLSDGEEALIAEASEARRGSPNHDQEFSLLGDLYQLLPCHEVRVPPLLVSQTPLSPAAAAALGAGKPTKRQAGLPVAVLNPKKISRLLEKSPFRLLSEAEWEYAARGGRDHQLTAWGRSLPDEALLQRLLAAQDGDALEPAANAFGVALCGVYPEVCGDAWRDDAPGQHYAGAPTDGRAVGGPGRRAVRGGAGLVAPWQGVGEWQLLLNAMRTSAASWDIGLAVRLGLGIR